MEPDGIREDGDNNDNDNDWNADFEDVRFHNTLILI
jgi:hypothetical protein